MTMKKGGKEIEGAGNRCCRKKETRRSAKQQFVEKIIWLGIEDQRRSGLSLYCKVGSQPISRGSSNLDTFKDRMSGMIQRDSDDDEIISPISFSITYKEDQRFPCIPDQSFKQKFKQRARDDNGLDGFIVLPADKKGESKTLVRKKVFSDMTYRYEPQYDVTVDAKTVGITLNSTTVRCLGNVLTALLSSLEADAAEKDPEDPRVQTHQQSLDSDSNCRLLRYSSCHTCAHRLHIGCFCKCTTHYQIQDTSEEDEEVDDPPAEWTKLRLRIDLKTASLELPQERRSSGQFAQAAVGCGEATG